MISVLHLLWIAPLCMLIGMGVAALFTAGDIEDEWRDRHKAKRKE